MKFTYTAIRKDGKQLKGNMEANSRSQAVETLAKQGLRPIALTEFKEGDKQGLAKLDIKRLGQRKKVKLKDLVVFTRQLATMINAGVSLVRSLQTLIMQTENPYFKAVLEQVTHDVEGGSSLADALAKHPNDFSDVYINMVKAGETAGILDDVLKRLATQVEKDANIRKKIKSASIYPAVLLVITIGAFFIIMLFVMPRIGKILEDLSGGKGELPTITRIMLFISDTTLQFWYIVLPLMFAAVYIFRRYIKTPKGKLKWHGLLLRTPILKNFIIKVAIARFARTFASLMSSGVGVLQALDVVSGAVGNQVITNELKIAQDKVKNGQQLSAVLMDSPHFPMIVGQMIAVGEETGQIDQILVKVADYYEEEVDTLIDGLASIIEPLLIVVLGAMVGLIAASVMGPITSLTQNIQE